MDEAQVREMFAVVGRRLKDEDAVPEEEIASAEATLRCRVPQSLRLFYRLAGNARDILDHYDHFLPPRDWSFDGARLLFLVENQGVVVYAVDTADAPADPPVMMANNQEPYDWYQVCASCSEFLRVMVHWEGAFGCAMPVTASALVDENVRHELGARFAAAGEVNEMWAYGAHGLAVCLVKWSDGWRIFVGASDQKALDRLNATGVTLELNE